MSEVILNVCVLNTLLLYIFAIQILFIQSIYWGKTTQCSQSLYLWLPFYLFLISQ